MNEREARSLLIGLWLEKAEQSLASAELELNAGHVNFAVNPLYYACFYSTTGRRENTSLRPHFMSRRFQHASNRRVSS